MNMTSDSLTQQEEIPVAAAVSLVFGAVTGWGEKGAESGVSRAVVGPVRSVHHHC
jgi:hypothetical protein